MASIQPSGDITIDQGASFALTLTYTDATGAAVNLTGYSARMQVRSDYASPDALIDASTTNGMIALGGSLGTVAVTIPYATTAALSVSSGVYDLVLTSPSGTRDRILSGRVTVSPGVTR